MQDLFFICVYEGKHLQPQFLRPIQLQRLELVNLTVLVS